MKSNSESLSGEVRVVASHTCEHCSYELLGLTVDRNRVLCPECGGLIDVRKGPEPVWPWWRTFVAYLAGCGVFSMGLFAYAVVCRLLGSFSKDLSMIAFMLALPLVSGTVAMLILRRRYADKWEYRYGGGSWPLRAWGMLLVEWFLNCVYAGGITVLVLWAVTAAATTTIHRNVGHTIP